MKSRTYSFDERCLDLARYFYPRLPDEGLRALAQQIQDACEGFLDHCENPEKCAVARAAAEPRA